MIAQQLVFDFCIFFSSFYLFECDITMWFSSSTNFHITNNTDKNNEKKVTKEKSQNTWFCISEYFRLCYHLVRRKKKPATFIFVVIICFMFLLKPNIHCSLLRWSVRVRLNKTENFFTVHCAPLMNLRARNAIMFPLFTTFCLSF